MGNAVADLSISNSYVGLLRLSSDSTGVSGSERTVYTSDGTDTCFSLGTNSATISGTLTADNANINDLTTTNLNVTGEITFVNNVTFAGPTNTISDGASFANNGTFVSTGVINSTGTATFTSIECTGTAVFGGELTFNNALSVKSNGITITAPLQVSAAASFSDITVNNISSATSSGSVTFKSPVILNGNLTTTSTTTIGGSQLTVNSTNTSLNTKVTCTSTAVLDLTGAKSVTAKTQSANNNSTAVATTAYVDRAVSSGGGSIPDYSNKIWLSLAPDTNYRMPCDAALTIGRAAGARWCRIYVYINGNLVFCHEEHASHHGHAGFVTTLIIGKGQNLYYQAPDGIDTLYYFPLK